MQRDRLILFGFVGLAILAALAGVAICLSMVIVGRPSPTPAPVATLPAASPAPTGTATPSLTPEPSSTASRTPTAKPTKTPRPPRPIKKIGPEIREGTHVELGHPPVIKLRNVTIEYVGEVRQQVGPDSLIVIRFEFDEPDKSMEPRQSAREWFGRRREDMRAMKAAGGPNIAFETAVNEPTDEDLGWYVPFSLELIPLMHADGLRCVAGNPAVGCWRVENWPQFRPVLDILNPDDFLGLHEYWIDTNDIANPWHCGRWTIPEIAAVLGNVKIVVTECGRDQVEGAGQAGWKRTCSVEDFLWDLEEYDRLLRRSANVVGATAFTIDRHWPDFNLFDIWPQVVYRYSLTPTPEPGQ